MKKDMKNKILISLLFGCIGITTEIFFTTTYDLIENFLRENPADLRLKGYTYVWMFFLYSLIPLLFDLGYPKIQQFPLLFRVLFYTVVIFSVEFLMGFLFQHLIGKCPWEYTTV